MQAKAFLNISSKFDPNYRAILTQAKRAGYVTPSASQQEKQNQLVIDLKSEGLWSKMDVLRILANDAGLNFSMLNLIDPKKYLMSMDANALNTHNANQSITSAVDINQNYTPSNHAVKYQLNNCCFGFYQTAYTNRDTNEIPLSAGNLTVNGAGGLENTQTNVVSTLHGFSNSILINKAGTIQNTLQNNASRTYYENGFHSVHLLNNVGNYGYNGVWDKATNNVPTGLPTSQFHTRISGATMSFSMFFIGSHLTEAETQTLKTLIDNYTASL